MHTLCIKVLTKDIKVKYNMLENLLKILIYTIYLNIGFLKMKDKNDSTNRRPFIPLLTMVRKIDIGAVKLKNASNTFGNVISHPTRAADLEDQKVKLHEVNRKTVLVFRKTATGELDYWVIGSVDFF